MILGKLGDMDKKRLQELEMVLVSFIKHNYIFISILSTLLSFYVFCMCFLMENTSTTIGNCECQVRSSIEMQLSKQYKENFDVSIEDHAFG